MKNSKREQLKRQKKSNSKPTKSNKNLIGALLSKQNLNKAPSEDHLYGFPPAIPKSELDLHISSQKNPNLRKMFRLNSNSKTYISKNNLNSFSLENNQEDSDHIIYELENTDKKDRKFYETVGAFYRAGGSPEQFTRVDLHTERKQLGKIQEKLRGKTADKTVKRSSFATKEDSILKPQGALHKRFKSFHNGPSKFKDKETTMPNILKKNSAHSYRTQTNFFLTHTNFHSKKSFKRTQKSVDQPERDIRHQIISESPFFKKNESENPSYKSTTILTQIRKKESELKTAYLNVRKIQSKNSKEKKIEVPSNLKSSLKNAELINSMIKADYDHFGSESENKVRNISYLYEKTELFRPKKKNPIEIMKPEENNKKKAMTIGEIRGILDSENFPKLGEDLFDIISKMKVGFFHKKKLKDKASGEREDYDDFSKKTCNYLKNFKVHGCYERSSSVGILKWLESIKDKYRRENKKFKNNEDYFRAMKDIIAFSNKEVIESEKKRCKETSLLIETLYMDNLNYIQNIFDYLVIFLKKMDKKHKDELDFMKMIGEKKLESMKFENTQLLEQNMSIKDENMSLMANLRKMNSKLNNDYLVIKSLRSELNYGEEMLRMTRLENEKITKIIKDMAIDLQHNEEYALAHISFEHITSRLMEIEKTHHRYQEELSSLNKIQQEKIKSDGTLTKNEKAAMKNEMSNFITDQTLMHDFETEEVGIQTDEILPEGTEEKDMQTEIKVLAVAEIQTDEYECRDCMKKDAILRSSKIEERFLIKEITKEKMQIIEEKEELEKEKEEIEKENEEVKNQNTKLEKDVLFFKEKLEEEKSRMEEILREKSVVPSSEGKSQRGSSFGLTPSKGKRKRRNSFIIPARMNSPALTIQPPENSIIADLIKEESLKRSSTVLKRSETPNMLVPNLTSFAMRNRLLTRGDSLYSIGFESNFSQEDDSISLASQIPDDVSYSELSNLGLRKVKKIHKAILIKLGQTEQDDDLYDFYKAKADMYYSYLKNHMKKRGSRRFRSKALSRTITKSTFRLGIRGSIKDSTSVASKKNKKSNELMQLATSLFNEALQMIKNNYIPKKKKLTRDITLVKDLMKIYSFFEDTEKSKGKIKTNFSVFVFRYLRNKNSHKKILSKKYKYLLYSVNHNMKISSIRLFAKFLGMDGSLDKGCLRVYLGLASKLKERAGVDIFKRMKTTLYIKWKEFKSLVQFYSKKYLANIEEKEKKAEIRSTIIKNAEFCTRIEKNQKVIDYDDCMNFLLEEHSLHAKDPISDFFETADLNGDGSLDYGEFIRITRHVEKRFYLQHKDSGLKEIFEDFAVLEEGEEDKVITPVTFKKLCRAHNIYNEKSQLRFLETVAAKGMTSSVDELKMKWTGIIKPKLELALIGIKNDDVKIFYNRLDGLILNFNEKMKHKIWLNYKILEAEIERLNLDKYVLNEIFPKELKKLDLMYLKEIDDEI